MNESWVERIEAYLEGQMSQDDKAEFEAELKINEELASVFRVYQTIETELNGHEKVMEGKASLKNILERLNKEFFRNENDEYRGQDQSIPGSSGSETVTSFTVNAANPKKITSWRNFAVAAALLAVIALSVTWYFGNEKKTVTGVAKVKKREQIKVDTSSEPTNKVKSKPLEVPTAKKAEDNNGIEKQRKIVSVTQREELYAANFKPDEPPADRSGPLQNAFEEYADKDYEAAKESFENVKLDLTAKGVGPDRRLTEYYASYYKALCYLAASNANPADAIAALKTAINKSTNDSLKSKAEWYLALAYLKKGELKQSKALLDKLSKKNSSFVYKKKAEKLKIMFETTDK